MFRSMLVVTALLAFLAGCATAPAERADAVPWRDAAFAHRPGMVTVTAADLFRLDDDLAQKVRQSSPQAQSPNTRLRTLTTLVFGADARRFAYAAGHSTTASETWRLQRGDCLSLTVLTYAVARAMDMAVQMQEVPTPALFDRRGDYDFVNQHVNVLFPRAHRDLYEKAEARDVVLDFEPELASARPGRPLDEGGIYARFLNNLAVEFLSRGDAPMAYAHFKAAIQADPGYASSYGNLAILYRKSALQADAEKLLQRAVALADQADVPAHSLHRLLADEGRDVEARRYESFLQARRTRDPYYWISLGAQALDAGDYRKAIRALEQARDMTGNFREVHAFLALAYWKAGEPERADRELTVLASLGAPESGVSKLRRKFHATPP